MTGLLIAALVGPARADRASTDELDNEVARRHYATGVTFYDAQEYARALREFEVARQTRPLPELDFNIARCQDRLGQWRAAIVAYRRYLASGARGEDAVTVRARVLVLEERTSGFAERAAARQPPPALAAPPPVRDEAEARRRGRRALAWGLGGALVGVGAALGLGLGLGLRGMRDTSLAPNAAATLAVTF